MTHERILQIASSIAQAGEEEYPLLEALCTAAEERLTGRLRTGLRPEQCADVFCCAAAMLAAADMLVCRGGGDVEQFRAGDVSVRVGGAGEAAAALRRQAACLMAPYWDDDSFAFLGVRG